MTLRPIVVPPFGIPMLKLLVMFLLPNLAWAHPVTFKDGKEIYVTNNSMMRSFGFTYSLTNKYSLGTSLMKIEDKDYYLLEGNFLVKRWNELGSQANLYLGAQGGLQNGRSIGGAMVEADWESREYYISSKYQYIDSNNLLRARLVFAPYLAHYNDLNTWFILEYDYMSLDKKDDITPLLRF